MDTVIEATETPVALAEYPLDWWYAATASQRLAGTPIAARVLDRQLALFRDADGLPHALEDRCAHRGAELHLGEVTDGSLACRFHGWRYAGDGRCVHIPSLVEGRKIAGGVGVRAFTCAESDAYVWVWLGAGSPVSAPPPIGEFGRFNWVQGVVPLECAALAAIENNLDWCHPVFAHAHTHPGYFYNKAMGFRDQSIEMRPTDRGMAVFALPTANADEPVPADALTCLTFELPDRVTVAFNAGPQGPMRIVMHMVPTGASTSRQEWMVTTGPADLEAGPQVAWTDDTHPIFEQDRQVLESVQRAVDREGRDFERSVEADVARTTHLRDCERWPLGPGSLGPRLEAHPQGEDLREAGRAITR